MRAILHFGENMVYFTIINLFLPRCESAGKGGSYTQFIDVFLCATTAWFAACLFTAVPAKESALSASAAGALCAAAVFLLSVKGIYIDLTLLLFLPLAFALPIREKWDREERLMALLTALGVYALFSFLCRQVHALFSSAGADALVWAIIVISCAGMYALRGWFPPKGWREYFEGDEQDRMGFLRWRIYIPLALMAVLEIALLYGTDAPTRLLSASVLIAAAAVLCWSALYTVCLMISYRKEKLTTLIDQSYHAEMQSFMSVIRSQRHDYNFHLHTLSGLIDIGDFDECRQYLHHLVQDSSSINTFLPVEDPAIAALIFSYRTMALEYGIEMHLDIQNDLKNVVTNVYETNKVIGNLLQNAIDEVRTHKDKSYGIYLYIIKRGEDCIIHTANKITLPGDTQRHLQEMYRPGFSTKANHEGIGLSSVQNLLRRYRGTLYSRIDGDTIHCFARIPLRMKRSQT